MYTCVVYGYTIDAPVYISERNKLLDMKKKWQLRIRSLIINDYNDKKLKTKCVYSSLLFNYTKH